MGCSRHIRIESHYAICNPQAASGSRRTIQVKYAESEISLRLRQATVVEVSEVEGKVVEATGPRTSYEVTAFGLLPSLAR